MKSIEEGYEGAIKAKSFVGKSGKRFGKFVVDPDEVETYKHKEILKKHGAKWFGDRNDPSKSGWSFTDFHEDPTDLLEKSVFPAIDEIASKEGWDTSKRDEVARILIDEFKSVVAGGEGRTVGTIKSSGRANSISEDPAEVERKVNSLKDRLLTILSDEEFKSFMKPILDFRRTQQKQYSLFNTIMIYFQDPEATYVLSKGTWERTMNREVLPDAKMLFVCLPQSIPVSRETRDEIKRSFLKEKGKAGEDALTPLEKRDLDLRIKRSGKFTGRYKWEKVHTDIRFTKPMEGKEDPFKEYDTGRKNLEKLEWYDASGNASQETMELAEAIRRVCEKEGINYDIEDIKSGARGYSSDGGKKIRTLSGEEENEDFIKTMVHELTHSLCHWEKSRFKMKKDYGTQEQEAELTAWIVLQMFGYDAVTKTATNYMGAWGLTAENASAVFDNMMKVADYIYKCISTELKNIQKGS